MARILTKAHLNNIKNDHNLSRYYILAIVKHKRTVFPIEIGPGDHMGPATIPNHQS